MENQDLEQTEIKLYPPESFNDETFKAALKEKFENENPEILAEVAENLMIDISNPEIRDEVIKGLCNDYVEEHKNQLVESVLDENPNKAYTALQELCFFSQEDYQYITTVEGKNASVELPTYIENRLENVSCLSTLLEFQKATNEAFAYTNNDNANLNIFKASQIRETLDSFAEGMPNEYQARINYINSKMYRKIASKSNVYVEGKAEDGELDCLRNVLLHTKDYKLVSYCENRIKSNNGDKQAIIRAYKRAIKATENPVELFKINNSLAKIYEEKSKIIGYTIPGSEKQQNQNNAEFYYKQVCKYSSKDEMIMSLKKVASVQWASGKISDWADTKEEIAMKHLKGLDRCSALISIGERLKENGIPYFEKAIAEADKKGIPVAQKLQIKKEAYENIKNKFSREKSDKYFEAENNLQGIIAQQNMLMIKGKSKNR